MLIIPGVYQFTIRNTNIFLICEETITIVDTGFQGSEKRITEAISGLGRSIEEVSLIIITHNHLDHIGGLPGLHGMTHSTSVLHRMDLALTEEGLPYSRFIRLLLKIPGVSLFWPLVYAKPDDIDNLLKGGEILYPLGGLEVIHTPGHTPGSISLFSQQKKILIVGDLLNNGHHELHLTPRSVSSDILQAKESVKQLTQLDFDILCCGHGRPIIGDASMVLTHWVRRKGF